MDRREGAGRKPRAFVRAFWLMLAAAGWLVLSAANLPVAVVGPETLDRRQLALQLAIQGNVELTPENIEPLLENWVDGVLLRREAERRGLGRDETTQALLAESERQYLITAVSKRITDTVRVSDNEIFDYYNRRKLDFATRVRFLYMVLPDENAARAALRDLKKNQDFRLLAGERSLDRSNNPRAETLLTGRGDTLLGLDPGLEETLHVLPLERVSGPIRAGSAWWLVKPLARIPYGTPPALDEARDYVGRFLELRRRRQVLERAIVALRKKARVLEKPPRGDTSGVLAAVNEARLTRRYLDLQIEDRATLKAEDVPRLREVWVKSELLFQEAGRQGLGRDETTLALFAARRQDFLTNRLLEQELGRISVAPTEAFDYFERHRASFLDNIRILHILVGSESLARELVAELKKGADFQQLARERSYDRFVVQGCESRYLDRLDPNLGLGPELEAVIFDLKPGSVSPILHTSQGYWLVKVTDRRNVRREISYDQAKDKISRFLFDLKTRQQVDGLLAGLRQNESVQLLPDDYWR